MSRGPALLGPWKVTVVEQVAGRTLRVIGGVPGDTVEFTDDGRYIIRTRPGRPVEYRYRVMPENSPPALDLYMLNPDAATYALYHLAGDELVICAVANGKERPTEILRSDERLWVLQHYRRTPSPRGRA